MVSFLGTFEQTIAALQPGMEDPFKQALKDRDSIVVEGQICAR